MRGFWLPIGLRAGAIFALGMLVYAGGHYLKHHTHFRAAEAPTVVVSTVAAQPAFEAGRHAERATSRLGVLSGLAGFSPARATPPDFIMDGTKAGSLVRFKGSRDAPDTRARFSLVVRLDAGHQASACDIAPVQPDDFDLERGFRCVASGETVLVPVGSVRFEPSGTTRAVKASSRMAQELAKGEPFAMDADLTGPMNLRVNGKAGELVQLKSDSHNTALVVHDDQGKEVVRMQAGKDGFSITVDTTSR